MTNKGFAYEVGERVRRREDGVEGEILDRAQENGRTVKGRPLNRWYLVEYNDDGRGLREQWFPEDAIEPIGRQADPQP